MNYLQYFQHSCKEANMAFSFASLQGREMTLVWIYIAKYICYISFMLYNELIGNFVLYTFPTYINII